VKKWGEYPPPVGRVDNSLHSNELQLEDFYLCDATHVKHRRIVMYPAAATSLDINKVKISNTRTHTSTQFGSRQLFTSMNSLSTLAHMLRECITASARTQQQF